MATIATALIVLVAAIHVYIVVLEMFLWRTPRGLQAFGTDQAFADASAPLAANQGLYNGFLVAGLIWGLVASEPIAFQVRIFFLACVVVAGVYGAATVNRRILVVQALPAALALAAVLIAGQGPRPDRASQVGRGLLRAVSATSQERQVTLGATLAPPKEPDMTRPLTATAS